MDCSHGEADAGIKPGALWSEHINSQHGLLGWALGELYGIADSRSSREQATDNDRMARLPDTAAQDAGSGKRDAQFTELLATLAVTTTTPAPTERFRLTADQAIHIFQLKTTKTPRTAALLAAKYGISPKAIRDIWTRKSWAETTRPYWST